MADNTIITQGRFTSDGTERSLVIRSDVDWIHIYNFTKMEADDDAGGAHYYWQRGMDQGSALEWSKDGSGNELSGEVITEGGVTLLDTSANPVGLENATVTAVSNATPPVVTATLAVGELFDGDVVRMLDITGASQIGGMDFTIDNVNQGAGTFELIYMVASGAGTTGSFRKIKWDPIYYPRHRYISDISTDPQAVIQLTVTHGFTIGQKVRILVPADFDMTEIDGILATIVDVDLTDNTITVDVDSSAFTAFDFPADAGTPFTPAMVVPVGASVHADYNANDLDDATDNQAFIGVTLGAGADGPAGEDDDVIYWVAGKSFSVDNE